MHLAWPSRRTLLHPLRRRPHANYGMLHQIQLRAFPPSCSRCVVGRGSVVLEGRPLPVNPMKAHGKGGDLVNISSIESFSTTAGNAHYSAAKAGINKFTQVAALETGPFGIRVNASLPARCRPQSATICPPMALPTSTPLGRRRSAPAGLASRRTLPKRSPSSPPTTHPGSPASPCSSTAAVTYAVSPTVRSSSPEPDLNRGSAPSNSASPTARPPTARPG
jgi:NAD(P)-dependent dehydrogenase (short-subunit alcohol dehydrogenase family)